jgi:hypothetical protein
VDIAQATLILEELTAVAETPSGGKISRTEAVVVTETAAFAPIEKTLWQSKTSRQR